MAVSGKNSFILWIPCSASLVFLHLELQAHSCSLDLPSSCKLCFSSWSTWCLLCWIFFICLSILFSHFHFSFLFSVFPRLCFHFLTDAKLVVVLLADITFSHHVIQESLKVKVDMEEKFLFPRNSRKQGHMFHWIEWSFLLTKLVNETCRTEYFKSSLSWVWD